MITFSRSCGHRSRSRSEISASLDLQFISYLSVHFVCLLAISCKTTDQFFMKIVQRCILDKEDTFKFWKWSPSRSQRSKHWKTSTSLRSTFLRSVAIYSWWRHFWHASEDYLGHALQICASSSLFIPQWISEPYAFQQHYKIRHFTMWSGRTSALFECYCYFLLCIICCTDCFR